MADRPHDVTDLYLAPVLLSADARLEELGQLDKDGLAYEVAFESDSPDFTRPMRQAALIRTIKHTIDNHHWEFSWDPRGLRLTHDAHTFVLGLPALFLEYLGEVQGMTRSVRGERAVATCYDKLAVRCKATVHVAAINEWRSRRS